MIAARQCRAQTPRSELAGNVEEPKKYVHPRADAPPRTAAFTRFKFQWLDQVLADHGLPAGALNVAYALASRYLNSKSLECWPAQNKLATDVGIGERQLRNLLSKLVEHGHLSVRRKGRGASNRYRPIIHDRQYTSGHDAVVTGNEMHDDRQDIAGMTGNTFPPNPMTEPCEEPHAYGVGEVALDISGNDARAARASIEVGMIEIEGFGPCLIEETPTQNAIIVRSINGTGHVTNADGVEVPVRKGERLLLKTDARGQPVRSSARSFDELLRATA